jgi:hypothetical protein
LVIGGFFAIKIDGGCPGSLGVRGHLEFFGSRLLKLRGK